jgi:hypothetical protein
MGNQARDELLNKKPVALPQFLFPGPHQNHPAAPSSTDLGQQSYYGWAARGNLRGKILLFSRVALPVIEPYHQIMETLNEFCTEGGQTWSWVNFLNRSNTCI